MFWVDRIAEDIIKSGKYKPYWVDDMKTPSGRIHVGSLRGVVIHYLVYKALLEREYRVKFTYVFEDHDPMDALPTYLDSKKWSQYLGQPLFTIPSPDGKAKSYAHYFAYEFQDVFHSLGIRPDIIWSGDLYRSGKMNGGIQTCLDQVATIRQIYHEIYKKRPPDDWFPFQLVCPQCGKESTTKVTGWDGKEVTFTCVIDAVTWTKGCGFSGKASPFSGDGKYVGKLPWKIEWAVKWQVIGVTIEGAGKDHMTAGGSHDIAKLICKRVLKCPVPYPIAYEFFLTGGKKMSSSKGLGSSSKEISQVLPPYLLRFLFVRTDYNQAINFDPVSNMFIPDLFDEYDRAWSAYNRSNKVDLARMFELSQIDRLPKKAEKQFLPRFRDVANYLQMSNIGLTRKFIQLKGSPLTNEESEILNERIGYAKLWLSNYAPQEFRFHMTETLPKAAEALTEPQKRYLIGVSKLLNDQITAEALQRDLYRLAKAQGINTEEAFKSIYLAFLGKPYGPQAAWFLLQYPLEKIISRLREAATLNEKAQETKVKLFSRPDLFSIDSQVKEKYPSVSVGVAIIRGITVKHQDPRIEQAKQEFLSSLGGLTTSALGEFLEINSYRRLYKEMGVDWHSRRPTTEALLRRVALGKGLYTINTCVDAYNLVVMKNRISLGAFDLDQIKLPATLRYAKKGESILLLGDSGPTEYTDKELAYFDQMGGYNIDFNYRDAQRTMVTEKTENIFINVDGVYDITPAQVEKTLRESIDIIIKYCGGTVEVSGIVA